MDNAMAQGLAAVINFWFNLLMLLAVIPIVASWLKVPDTMVLGMVRYIMYPLLRPFRAITPKSENMDWGSALFIAVMIPIQFILVHKLRTWP